MSKALQKKIEEVRDEHATEIHDDIISQNSIREEQQLLLMLGAVGAFNYTARDSQTKLIKILQQIKKKKSYRSFGFQTFESFLDEYEFTPMKYKKFNYLEKQFEAEGIEVFEVLNKLDISMSTRKLIAQNGDVPITVDGDDILIGDDRADLSDLPLIKALITKLATSNEKFSKNKESQDKKIRELETTVEEGSQQVEALRRQVNKRGEEHPFKIALSDAVLALIDLRNVVKTMSAEEKKAQAENAVSVLFAGLQNVKETFGIRFEFVEGKINSGDETINEFLEEEGLDDLD